jgi:hypothetical protein
MAHYAPKRGVESTLQPRIKRILKDRIADVSCCGGTAAARKCLVVLLPQIVRQRDQLAELRELGDARSGTTFALIVPEQRRGFYA